MIRSDIGHESVEKCRDVQNEPIFGKKLRDIVLHPFFKTPLYFLETEDSIFMTLYKYYTFSILKSIQLCFFYILINIKYSSYDCISKSQKKSTSCYINFMDLHKLKIFFLSLYAQLNLTST
jgi:hypothetical protein